MRERERALAHTGFWAYFLLLLIKLHSHGSADRVSRELNLNPKPSNSTRVVQLTVCPPDNRRANRQKFGACVALRAGREGWRESFIRGGRRQRR